jgi:hypothetical protein
MVLRFQARESTRDVDVAILEAQYAFADLWEDRGGKN